MVSPGCEAAQQVTPYDALVNSQMNDFLANLSADSPLLWALFVVGVVAASALALSVVTGLMLRLVQAFAGIFGRQKTAGRDDVVS